MSDLRPPGKVQHGLDEIVRQRPFAIALGYPDANDTRVLAEDPIHKLLAGRAPVSGAPLASQSTLSRFENGVRQVDLYRGVDTIAETVIDRHRRRVLDFLDASGVEHVVGLANWSPLKKRAEQAMRQAQRA